MPTIRVKETFRFADDGFTVVTYEEGQEVEVSELCAKIAIKEKWAEKASAPAAGQSQA
jgi:hypothetical protein